MADEEDRVEVVGQLAQPLQHGVRGRPVQRVLRSTSAMLERGLDSDERLARPSRGTQHPVGIGALRAKVAADGRRGFVARGGEPTVVSASVGSFRLNVAWRSKYTRLIY